MAQGWAALWVLAGARMGQGSPLVDEGVEAGEDEEGHHGAERHEVVKHGLQVGGGHVSPTRLVPQVASVLWLCKAADEILQGKEPGGAKVQRGLPPAHSGHPCPSSGPIRSPGLFLTPQCHSSHPGHPRFCLLHANEGALCRAVLPHLQHGPKK